MECIERLSMEISVDKKRCHTFQELRDALASHPVNGTPTLLEIFDSKYRLSPLLNLLTLETAKAFETSERVNCFDSPKYSFLKKLPADNLPDIWGYILLQRLEEEQKQLQATSYRALY